MKKKEKKEEGGDDDDGKKRNPEKVDSKKKRKRKRKPDASLVVWLTPMVHRMRRKEKVKGRLSERRNSKIGGWKR